MRMTMVGLWLGAAALCACAIGALGERQAAAQDAAKASGTVSEETLKGVEIMRRVLVREGLGARSNPFYDTSVAGEYVVYSHAWGGANSVSEAFVVPGQGVTFVLRTSDAVAAPKSAATGDETPAAKPTAWDEEAAGLEGRRLVTAKTNRADRFEVAKVDALRGRLVEQLRAFGTKIPGLAAGERLTVIVVGSGSDTVSVNLDNVQRNAVPTVVAALRGQGPGRTVLALHVSVGDCQSAASGSLSAEEFARRVVVSAY